MGEQFCFLVIDYKDKYFFWEFVIWARKILLVGLDAAFVGSADDKIIAFYLQSVLLIFSVSQVLQVRFKPYRYDVLNEMAEMIGWYTIITLSLCNLKHNGFVAPLLFVIVSVFGSIVFLIWFIIKYHTELQIFSFTEAYRKANEKEFDEHQRARKESAQ